MNTAINANSVHINFPPSVSESGSSFSISEMAGAMANSYAGHVVNAVMGEINNRSDIPVGVKDRVETTLSNALAEHTFSGNAGADGLTDVVQEFLRNAAQEEVSEAGETANKKAGGGGGGNWLVQLARAMGDVAGKHLENMVGLANEISSLEGGETIDTEGLEGDKLSSAKETNADVRASDAREMAGLTAEMQAESQMFKMTQEMTTTVVKGIGEALHSTARKQ